MNIKVVGAAVIAGALLLGGGLVIANNMASKEAERRVEDFIYDNKLRDFVRYDGVSASVLSGSATLNNVTLTSGPSLEKPVLIKRLTLSDYKEEEGNLVSVKLAAEGIEIPVTAIARSGEMDAELDLLVGMGYGTMTGSAMLGYKITSRDRRIDLQMKVDLDDAMAVDWELGLAGIDHRQVADMVRNAHSLQDGNMMTLVEIASMVTRLELASVNIDIRDKGANSRSFELLSEGDFTRKPAAEVAKTGREKLLAQLTEELHAVGFNEREAAALSQTLVNSSREGGRLRVKSDISRPLPVFVSSPRFPGVDIAADFKDLRRFFQAAKLRVEN
ncbi:hypothetical protein [Telmatospirillum sp. J64-1]|uniref:hypothetical protein n=1 Tax=Telmatospirillum sp. J64-1 TaxID=2502183 RepID=UPI00115D89F6|nr:hypothetical protein [Telmatospirillum sp. J64-1]